MVTLVADIARLELHLRGIRRRLVELALEVAQLADDLEATR